MSENNPIIQEQPHVEFDDILESHLSRRGFLSGAIVMGTATFVSATAGLTPKIAQAISNSRFSFEQVAANGFDTITVPAGYRWNVVAQWGQALWSNAPKFDIHSRGNANSQSMAFGDNCDGMALFQYNGHNLLAVNNEYTTLDIICANRASGKPETDDDIKKVMAAHGVSIIEIKNDHGQWTLVQDSPWNRRITPDTPMDITGPARGSQLLQTAADPSGTNSNGTVNNCGNGRTPWGTYLTCEENFNSYFSSSDADFQPSAEMERYGLNNADRGYRFANVDERFDISKHPNETNRFGYIVEIDPSDPTSTPKKHTALGRLKHENAELLIADNGHIVVYMGDDEQGEFLYKFVSKDRYAPGANHSSLLTEGTLFAAKFYDDSTGVWLPLTSESTNMNLEEICVYTRIAASKVGATTMDRPEWVAANPHRSEVYCALTNNTYRGIEPNAGGDETPVNGPNPRAKNQYGQIVRWQPENNDHTSDKFNWNLYLMAGNPTQHKDAYAGSNNINALNMFNSPDGLAFDESGMLWIQTDGKYTDKGDFQGMGNNQMLVGDTITGEIRRFLVGPLACEVTGSTWSADRRTLFISIQHPGENGVDSHFPNGGDTIPRSAVIAISRKDGNIIG